MVTQLLTLVHEGGGEWACSFREWLYVDLVVTSRHTLKQRNFLTVGILDSVSFRFFLWVCFFEASGIYCCKKSTGL